MRRTFTIALVIAFAAFCFAAKSSAASPVLGLDEYRDLLEVEQAEVEKVCAGGPDANDAQAETAIQQIRRKYRNYQVITVDGGGEPQKVDMTWFDRGLSRAFKLKGQPRFKALTELAALLGAARKAVSGLTGLPAADGKARITLARILERSEFRHLDPNRKESWLERLKRQAGELLKRLLQGTGEALRIVFNVPVAIAVVVFSIAYLIWRLGSRMPGGVGAEEAPEREALLALGPDKLANQAAGIARNGDCRQAMRLLYLALLARLDRARLLQYVPYRTNWEYLNQLRENDGKVAGLFADFTFLFERKWYGMEICSIADYEAALGAYHRLLSEGGL